MTVKTLHQPESTVDTNVDSQSPNASSIDFSKIKNYTLLYIPALAWALKNLQIPHPGEAALFLSQLAFWLNNNSGHFTKDGRKWIYNSYSDWVEQIPSLTEYQFGVMIRSLVFHELIEKSCYASLRKQLEKTQHPVSWHPDNTSSWMTLNIERIIELTNWHPFDNQKSTDNDQTSEPAKEAEIVNPTSGDCKSNFAKLGTQFSSIYIEDSISTKDGETSREREQINYFPDPWIDQQEDNFSFDGLKSESSVKTQDQNEGQFSAPPQTTNNTNNTNYPKGFGATNNTKATQKAQRNVSNEISAPLTKLKSEKIDRPLYVWEEALNYPNPYFLQWWANRHYKPQGGKWETGARLFALSQFYNDPVGADIIYQEYLLFMDTVANNADQQQNQNLQAILPSCFVKYPEVNQQNKEQLAKNIATVAARGAGVAIPGNVAPGSTQHMSLEEANGKAEIKPLPKLEQPALSGTGQQQNSLDLKELTTKVEFANKLYHEYKNNTKHKCYKDTINWVKRTPGVVITESGISLETSLLQENLQQPHL